MKPIVLFGAGSGSVKVIKTIRNIGYDIAYLTDNNKNKWGSFCENIEIIPPEKLTTLDCHIMIASVYQEEIEQQLIDMGVFDKVILKEQLILEYFGQTLDKFEVDAYAMNQKAQTTILFDMMESIEYGGIEKWSYTVAEELLKNNHMVKFIGMRDKIRLPEMFEPYMEEFDIDYEKYKDSIYHVMDVIRQNLPCSILVNRQGAGLIAAVLMKHLYPGKVHVISISHTDRIWLHRRVGLLQNEIDDMICVSSQIANVLHSKFGVNRNKLHYKLSPIEFQRRPRISYSDANSPIQIGYAARLTKAQKRVDLLLPLILKLDELGVNYQMNIAGTGDYLSKLQTFVEERRLDKRVHVLGLLSSSEMEKFWNEQDIYINVSEYEGTSLAMLEAMAHGVVPIVTLVSGVTDVVEHGVNGYICKQHDTGGMADIIKAMNEKRDTIEHIGRNAQNIIFEKCDKSDYAEYVWKICIGKKSEEDNI